MSDPFESLVTRSAARAPVMGPAVNLRPALDTACRVIRKARAVSVSEEICSSIERLYSCGSVRGRRLFLITVASPLPPMALIGGPVAAGEEGGRRLSQFRSPTSNSRLCPRLR